MAEVPTDRSGRASILVRAILTILITVPVPLLRTHHFVASPALHTQRISVRPLALDLNDQTAQRRLNQLGVHILTGRSDSVRTLQIVQQTPRLAAMSIPKTRLLAHFKIPRPHADSTDPLS